MSIDPDLNAADGTNRPSPADESGSGANESVPELKREIERLRTRLTEATAEAERYRRAAYALLTECVPYTPPGEDELRDLLHGPRGRPLLELIDELERESQG
jgi:hypothetical protein